MGHILKMANEYTRIMVRICAKCKSTRLHHEHSLDNGVEMKQEGVGKSLSHMKALFTGPLIEHGTRGLGQGVILVEIVVPKPCAVVEPLKVHRNGEGIRRIVVVELGRLEGP